MHIWMQKDNLWFTPWRHLHWFEQPLLADTAKLVVHSPCVWLSRQLHGNQIAALPSNVFANQRALTQLWVISMILSSCIVHFFAACKLPPSFWYTLWGSMLKSWQIFCCMAKYIHAKLYVRTCMYVHVWTYTYVRTYMYVQRVHVSPLEWIAWFIFRDHFSCACINACQLSVCCVLTLRSLPGIFSPTSSRHYLQTFL